MLSGRICHVGQRSANACFRVALDAAAGEGVPNDFAVDVVDTAHFWADDSLELLATLVQFRLRRLDRGRDRSQQNIARPESSDTSRSRETVAGSRPCWLAVAWSEAT